MIDRRVVVPAVCVASMVAGLVVAGPLNPPVGPVASTYKTLTEVEPRVAVNAVNTPGTATAVYQITQPGSYYLVGNVAGAPGKSGIEIACGGVTLDLRGFEMAGVEGSLDAIRFSAQGTRGVQVRHGTLRGWGGSGLNCLGYGYGCVFEDLRAVANAQVGIGAATGSTVRDCVATENVGVGILALFGSVVERCTAYANLGDGFELTQGCAATGCVANSNSGSGFSLPQGGAVLTGCSALGNSGRGIDVGQHYPEPGAATISACTCVENSMEGIRAVDGATITGCTSSGNSSHGVAVGTGCTVRGCTVNGNGPGTTTGAGILAWSDANRIEDNNCHQNRLGISATGGDNVIVRNTARGNPGGNFSIGAGNEAAPVVTNPGSSGFSTMTPWSNVAY